MTMKKITTVAALALSLCLSSSVLTPIAAVNAADAPTSQQVVPKNGVATIHNAGTEGAPVMALSNSSMNPAGHSLANNTQWQIFGTIDLKGTSYTNVGGNQWVNSMYVADAADTPAMTPASFVGRINYVPGYGVRLFQINGSTVTNTGRYLQHGTTWKVSGTITINGRGYTNLGGNQWVESQYIVNAADSSATDDSSLPNGTFAVISYAKGYGIAVWQQNSNGTFSVANHAPLTNGTRWAVHKKTTANGRTYYNLGGNQWIQADYAVVGRATGDALTLDVPYVSQYNPVFAPWGCAATAMSMLLGYDGVTIDKSFLTYAQDHLPMYPGNPGGQKGNVYTGAGFGWVIGPNALTDYAHNWDKKVVNVSGASTETIKQLVLTGHPVLYYGWSSYQNLKADTNRNHCKVILGYKDGQFLVHDPLYSNSSKTAGQGGTKELGYNNGYDQGAIYWSTMSKFNAEYNGQALSVNR